MVVNAFGAKILTKTNAWMKMDVNIGEKRERCGKGRVSNNTIGAGSANRLSKILIDSDFLVATAHFV